MVIWDGEIGPPQKKVRFYGYQFNAASRNGSSRARRN